MTYLTLKLFSWYFYAIWFIQLWDFFSNCHKSLNFFSICFKNTYISGPLKFKPLLFIGQLYIHIHTQIHTHMYIYKHVINMLYVCVNHFRCRNPIILMFVRQIFFKWPEIYGHFEVKYLCFIKKFKQESFYSVNICQVCSFWYCMKFTNSSGAMH